MESLRITTMNQTYENIIEEEREQRASDLVADRSWFTLAGLFWLNEGENRVGSDPTSAVILDEAYPPHAGSFYLEDYGVTLVPQPDVDMMVNDQPLTGQSGGQVMQSDMSGNPDWAVLGSLSFLVIERGERIGIRIFDSEAEPRRQFQGLDWYAVDPAWQITARFEPYDPPKPIHITNILGDTHEAGSPGKVVFEQDGQRYELDAEARGEGLFFNFRDATNKSETYGAGRFLYAKLPEDESGKGEVVLDFNRATNPYCAYTAYATCPLPPQANTLELAVTAGEKRYSGI